MIIEKNDSHTPQISYAPNNPVAINSIVNEVLSIQAFRAISGKMAGYPFVKVVVQRETGTVHFINDHRYKFHGLYIAENLLHISEKELFDNIDTFNQSFYLSPKRPFFLGILALHSSQRNPFFTLETVEIDNMDSTMTLSFFQIIRKNLEQTYPLFFKPANHSQESMVQNLSNDELPRIYNHELFATEPYVALNEGETTGRLRYFKDLSDYRQNFNNIKWYDILVMDRVPESVPRVSGLINTQHTTPLSHTNVLACGWQIPNAIQLDIGQRIDNEQLNDQWVKYKVSSDNNHIILEPSTPPSEVMQRPTWKIQQVKLEAPEVAQTPIQNLDSLRMMDRFRYGTKAANLGELRHILNEGSARLLGFYQIRRPPRRNLLPYVAKFLKCREEPDDLQEAIWDFLKETIEIPRGIAIPFSYQQEFLSTSAQLQQQIGKLKMALELEAKQIDSLCLTLQQMIRSTRMTDRMRDSIDNQLVRHLSGVSSFVVRSSSNAEDLEDFPAAGIYESINHVTTADKIFNSIKEVWASMISPRSVRMRHDVGISLDDCYMGVIIQEEIQSQMGGVMVTMNPTSSSDFRDVFLNVSSSPNSVVDGSEQPMQYLFNTVEGGGRTLSIGNAKRDLDSDKKALLQKLAFSGRFLQSHFSKDYTFSSPQDIEWAFDGEHLYILQLRPYAK